MDRFRRIYEYLEKPCSEISHKITQDVHDDDACGRELNVHPSLEADDQSQSHREHCQEQFVFNAGESASQCDGGMQEGEDMYDPRCLYVFYRAHVHDLIRLQVSNFVFKLQFWAVIRRKKTTVHRELMSFRQTLFARLIYNDYFYKLEFTLELITKNSE